MTDPIAQAARARVPQRSAARKATEPGTFVRLPAELKKRLKLAAAGYDLTQADIHRALVMRYLEDEELQIKVNAVAVMLRDA